MESMSVKQETQSLQKQCATSANQPSFGNIQDTNSNSSSSALNKSNVRQLSDQKNQSAEQDSQVTTKRVYREDSASSLGEILSSDKCFHLFPDLPYELRQKIWRICIIQCIQSRQVIASQSSSKLMNVNSICHPRQQTFSTSFQFEKEHHCLSITSEPLPRLILACREVATAGTFKPMLMKHCSRKLLYSPIFDTFVLRGPLHPFLAPLNDTLEQETLERIRHVKIAGDLSDCHTRYWLATNLVTLTGLKSLIIAEDGLVVPGCTAPPNVNMMFRSSSLSQCCCGGDEAHSVYIPICTVDGQLRSGWKAIAAIFERVTDAVEQERYISIWGFLNYAAWFCNHLPFSISISIRYTVYCWNEEVGSDGLAVDEQRLFDYGDVIDGLVTLD